MLWPDAPDSWCSELYTCFSDSSASRLPIKIFTTHTTRLGGLLGTSLYVSGKTATKSPSMSKDGVTWHTSICECDQKILIMKISGQEDQNIDF